MNHPRSQRNQPQMDMGEHELLTEFTELGVNDNGAQGHKQTINREWTRIED